MRLNSVQLQKQELRQKATQKMVQSLQVLCMSQVELKDYLQEAYESNPLLEITEVSEHATFGAGSKRGSVEENYGGLPESFQQTFVEYLYEQLMFLPNLDDEQRMLCKYLILCLDHKGYLEASLDELAVRVGATIETMERALFQLQQLEPAGVGARSLEECLRLQAMRDPHATEAVYRLIELGLHSEMIKDAAEVAKALECPLEEAIEAMNILRSYHPIPSSGFSDGRAVEYTIPEAEIQAEGGALQIHLNRSFLPQLRYNESAVEMLQAGSLKEQAYLQQCKKQAETVLTAMTDREHTVRLLLEFIAGWQKNYFLSGKAMEPLTMVQAAEAIGVHPSTISRAVRDKYILFHGQQIPLRSFFVSKVSGGTSSHAVKQRLTEIIKAEPTASPYSDDAIQHRLEEEGVQVSRRAIAKYRQELHIPAAHKRRRMTEKRKTYEFME